MRRLGFLVVTGIFGFILIGTAVSAPADQRDHLRPAPTSIDHAPFCGVPTATTAAPIAVGATAVSFTLVAPGCD